MKTKLSALIDGELDIRETREVCFSMRQDNELRRACGVYALIGDALRREPHLASELTGAVLDRLADDPVVLAPQRVAGSWSERKKWHRPLLALAATAAGVAVVAWLGLPKQMTNPAALQTQQIAEQKAGGMAVASDADMQEYLIAHQIHSGSVSLNGETQHIRTVSLNGAESRR